MRRNDPLSLGIELHEREIRLVQAGMRGGRPYVAAALAVPLPQGAVLNSVVLEPSTIVIALRRALETMGVPAAEAAVGVSGEQSNFRAISIPPCPASELPALIASEIEHQGVLNPGDLYDFFPVHPAVKGADSMQNLAVVGLDPSVADTLVEVLEGAGLKVAAIEPTPLSMLRTATEGLGSSASAFVLAVGASVTDAAFFVDGRLAAFRRLDVGIDSLVHSFAPTPDLGEANYLYGGVADGTPEATENWSVVDGEAADRLALEAQRTMDYVQRADGSAATLDRVRIVCDDERAKPLAAMLERRFGLTVETVLPPASDLDGADVRFSAAYGLAVRSLGTSFATPAVDLFMAGRIEARRIETKRYFLASVLVAALSVVVAFGSCLLYNRQIAAARHRSANTKAEIAAAKKTIEVTMDARADEALRDKSLRKEGVPLGVLMDYVANGVDSGVGLKLVTVGDDLTVRLQGEARDETSIVKTAQALKASPLLLNVAVDRFDRDEKAPKGAIQFVLSGMTVSADRVTLEARQG